MGPILLCLLRKVILELGYLNLYRIYRFSGILLQSIISRAADDNNFVVMAIWEGIKELKLRQNFDWTGNCSGELWPPQ